MTKSPKAVVQTVAILWAVLTLGAGCQRPVTSKDEPQAASSGIRPAAEHNMRPSTGVPSQADASAAAVPGSSSTGAEATLRSPDSDNSPSDRKDAEPREVQAPVSPAVPQPVDIDLGRIAAAGLRRLEGNHLTLYTDVAEGGEVDGLPAVFDQACPLWCSYFNVSPKRLDGWRMIGCLMKDSERFRTAGLLSEDMPPFLHGFARGGILWLYDQPTDYYRRHLLLHEGMHAFTDAMLGGEAPPWYREGIAELLATHRLENGRLQLGWFPQRRQQVPMLGRIKLVQQAVAGGRLMGLEDVLHLSSNAFLKNEPYAWSWALAAFLDRHPRYRDRFRRLASEMQDSQFADRFRSAFVGDWQRLDEEWQIFAAELEHGHDLDATAIDFAAGEPLQADGQEVAVRADSGWQNTSIWLEKGQRYHLRARGRYQVAQEPQVWWCEPGGVSIRYYKGRPLGILLAAVRADGGEPPADRRGLLEVDVIGLESAVTFPSSGTLYLRINDSAGELGDNVGSLTVSVQHQ